MRTPAVLVSLCVLGAASAQPCEAGFRRFDHELLATEPVCIPESAQRVVALEPTSLDLLLSAGTPPVGAIGYLENVVGGNFPYLQGEFTEITNLGFPVSIEATLEADPDLIIASSLESDYDELAAVAPTVVYTSPPNAAWKETTRFMAQVLGLEDEAERLLAGYQARVDALHEAVTEKVGNPAEVAVSVIRIYDDEGGAGLQMQLADAFSSVMLADAGLGRPASQAYSAAEAGARYGSAVAATLSLEQLPLLDSDVLIAWSQGADTETDAANDAAWDEIGESPLWRSLAVVEEGAAYRTGGHWVGWGFHAAHAVLDDLFELVAGVNPANVSPNPFLGEEAAD